MSSNETAILIAGLGATLQLFRLSVDLVVAASQKDAKSIEKIEKTTASELRAQSLKKSTKIFDGRLSLRKRDEEVVSDDKPPNTELESNHSTEPKKRLSSIERFVARASDMLTGAGLAYFLTLFILMLVDDSVEAVYGAGPCGCLVASFFLSGVVSLRDRSRSKFSKVHRVLHALSAFIIGLGVVIRISMTSESLSNIDIASTAVLMTYLLVVLLECRIIRYPETAKSDKKARLSTRSILIVLKPYFWPDATATSATLNRIRAVSTWVFVVASKACGLLAPIYIGRASTELTRWNWEECILNVVWFSLLTFASAFLKEAQSLVYLKVAQVAFVQLAEISFSHLHGLSLDWHLRKKLGEVLRGMSRGISACDTLVKYLFLWLVPAIGECFLVAVIFSLYFDDLTLAVTVFFFVFAYMLLTVLLTLWRKKFRKQVARSDNDWNDVATDSLINFETVKYFTAEEFEKKKFGEAVLAFQKGNVNVAASLSALNTAQRFLLQACLVTALSIVVLSIRDRARCCVASGCEVGDFDCCDTLEAKCVGNKIGDFVAVLTYTINLFTPLNFLGSVYNMIVMAVVDLQNLSELLAEKADVQDAKDALELPKANPIDPDSVIEFDNVHFHYPSQPESSGLKGVSFKMKKGTTTAIVGSTGAGKTTISRLVFRFYDVTSGSVRVNGTDVRMLKQKSLREQIGVVPQATTLFNDTLKANIAYGKQDASEAEIEEAINAAQLSTFVESLPEGLEAMVGDRGLKLSGGEKQRTAIARCLLKNPSICIFDEATSSLDTITEQSVKEALDRLGSDRTVLVIAHRLGTIKNADQIIVLRDGLIGEKGTHDELLALGGQYAAMWNMQLDSTRGSQASLVES